MSKLIDLTGLQRFFDNIKKLFASKETENAVAELKSKQEPLIIKNVYFDTEADRAFMGNAISAADFAAAYNAGVKIIIKGREDGDKEIITSAISSYYSAWYAHYSSKAMQLYFGVHP